jgi:hypothetical protein
MFPKTIKYNKKHGLPKHAFTFLFFIFFFKKKRKKGRVGVGDPFERAESSSSNFFEKEAGQIGVLHARVF